MRGKGQSPAEEAEEHKKLLEITSQPGWNENVEKGLQESKEELKKKQQLDRIQKEHEGFVFDESEVLQDKSFIFLKLNQESAGIGLFMPRNMTIKTKEGFSSTQKDVPVIIYSNPSKGVRKLLQLSNYFENREFKIKIRVIPDESVFPRRWNLTNIQHYLAGEYSAISLAEIFQEIKNTYKQFCYFSNEIWYSVHALWDIGTYFYKLFDYYPILELRGQMATGKTKIMSISRLFTFNPTQEMTNPSEATLFREGGKTQYIDEAEKIFYRNSKNGQMEGDTRAEIINSGFKKTGSVSRQEKLGERFRTINFSTYSPRMIGSINGLFGATEDRAIIHTTTPAPKSDKRAELEPDEEDVHYNKLRCALHIGLLERWQDIEEAYRSFENNTKLKQRDLNIWKPLLILAREIDQDLYNDIKDFAETLSGIKRMNKLDENSLEFWVIKLALSQLEEHGAPLILKGILEGMPQVYENIKSKTIGRILDKIGLYELKHRTNKGFVYRIGYAELKEKIEISHPEFFSTLSSLSTLNRGKDDNIEVNKGEETHFLVKQTSLDDIQKGEESEANEASEANLDKGVSEK